MPDILLIMHQPGNLRVLAEALESHGYNCIGAGCAKTMDEALKDHHSLNLALVDVSEFGPSVWLMCERLQQADVPFIVLSAKQQLGVYSRTLGYGATTILTKPIVKASLLQLIDNFHQAEKQHLSSSAETPCELKR